MHHPRSSWSVILSALALLAPPGAAQEPVSGWRGNGTGLWPDANPPLEWHRRPRGALEGLRTAVNRPKGHEPGDAPHVPKGLPRAWLILGPFAVEDSVKDFDRDLLGGETAVEPSAGLRTAEREWMPATVPPDDIMVFGTAELPWLDLAKVVGFQRNQVAYAHTYLFSPRGGPARIVVDHGHGLKAWLNGKEVYRAPERRIALGSYVAISQHELHHRDQPSARFELELHKGWNRLLLKLSTSNRDDFKDQRCTLRLIDPPDVEYESKNILWMASLPGRSTSTPILVGDRLFVMAEPDELHCIDKNTGHTRWSAAVNAYEALTPEERKLQPAYASQIDPLRAKLKGETDRRKRTQLRAEIQNALRAIDEARFGFAGSDHFAAHFGIVGFTMPTPVSDGKQVFAWCSTGVAACFDLEGNRQWITRVATDELSYGSSPALADGVLVVFLNGLYGLDARTGKQLWQQKKVRYNLAAVLGATLAGQSVVVTQRGDVIRPSDGELLFRQRLSSSASDTGWAPPVLLGNRMYLPRYGVTELNVWDFSAVTPKAWEPKLASTITTPREVTVRPDGKWIDRWTAGSPLVWQGIAYQVDIYQTLYAADLKSGKTLYHQALDLQGLTHYNAVAVAASPTLVGKHLVVQDNQGTALVLDPGPSYRVIARNHLGTQLDRGWPIPAQETLGYAPPLAEGRRLYLRGEAYLYCVGER